MFHFYTPKLTLMNYINTYLKRLQLRSAKLEPGPGETKNNLRPRTGTKSRTKTKMNPELDPKQTHNIKILEPEPKSRTKWYGSGFLYIFFFWLRSLHFMINWPFTFVTIEEWGLVDICKKLKNLNSKMTFREQMDFNKYYFFYSYSKFGINNYDKLSIFTRVFIAKLKLNKTNN